ncbi:MAG: hypothetical protein AAF555_11330 [Verrucomicrobiota bacterium]
MKFVLAAFLTFSLAMPFGSAAELLRSLEEVEKPTSCCEQSQEEAPRCPMSGEEGGMCCGCCDAMAREPWTNLTTEMVFSVDSLPESVFSGQTSVRPTPSPPPRA